MPFRDSLRFGPLAPEEDEFDPFNDVGEDPPPQQEGDDTIVAEGGVSESEDESGVVGEPDPTPVG